MSDDLSRFLRAVKTLAQLAHKYSHEAFLDALGQDATVKQENDVWFVGTFLDDIGQELSKRRAERCCRQCGQKIGTLNQAIANALGVSVATVRADTGENERDARGDQQYCSAKCRQKAYRRRRVTAWISKHASKCNETCRTLRLAPSRA